MVWRQKGLRPEYLRDLTCKEPEWITNARDASSPPRTASSTMTMSLTPDVQRERADDTPTGPAPTIRTVVLDGKDIVEMGFDGDWRHWTRVRMFKYVGV